MVNSMLEYFLAFIKQHQLIARKEQVIVAISGGVDSMVMADLFKKSPYSFAIAHINYGLRGEDSNKDEQLVKSWCEQNDIDCFIKKAPKEIFQGKASVQMAARTFRYHFFDEILNAKKYHKIATAHHLDDSLETALFNFSKGTGLRGLVGIAPMLGDVIRPMLFAEKADILAYAKEHKIKWREDLSNEQTKYQRNKIRHEVIPVLKSINPGLLNSFRSVSQRVTDAQDLLTQKTEEIKRVHLKTDRQVITMELSWMNEFHNPRSILMEALRHYAFSFSQVRDIYEVILSGAKGKLFFSESYELNVDRDLLVIRLHKEDMEVNEKLNVPGSVSIQNHVLSTEVLKGNTIDNQNDSSIAFVDFDQMKQLKVTGWQEGDIFYPLGMKGKKKVSDFMIDSKIPLTLKRDVLIIRSEEEIVWVVSHRIDDRFKVTEKTQKMLRIQFQENV